MALLKLKPIDAIDFATFSRPTSPNSFLVCPHGFSRAEPDQEAPIYSHSIDSLISAWTKVIAANPRTKEIQRSADGIQRTWVQRSLLMGYPDVITVEFIRLSAESATLAIYSWSQYGHSDFGVNRRRIAAWLSNLSRRLG
jgi:uncharacterized protein (DUF1499 family)